MLQRVALKYQVEGLKPSRTKPARVRGGWGGTSPLLQWQPGQGGPRPPWGQQLRPSWGCRDAGKRRDKARGRRQDRATAPAGGRITPGLPFHTHRTTPLNQLHLIITISIYNIPTITPLIFYSEAAPKSVLKRRELIVPSLKIYRLPPIPKKEKAVYIH